MEKAEIILKTIEYHLGYCFKSSSRKRHIIYARALYYKLARELTGLPLEEIGRFVDKPDHAIVLNGIKTFDNDIKGYEPKIMEIYNIIYSSIKFDIPIIVKDVDLINYGIRF